MLHAIYYKLAVVHNYLIMIIQTVSSLEKLMILIFQLYSSDFFFWLNYSLQIFLVLVMSLVFWVGGLILFKFGCYISWVFYGKTKKIKPYRLVFSFKSYRFYHLLIKYCLISILSFWIFMFDGLRLSF